MDDGLRRTGTAQTGHLLLNIERSPARLIDTRKQNNTNTDFLIIPTDIFISTVMESNKHKKSPKEKIAITQVDIPLLLVGVGTASDKKRTAQIAVK